MEEKQQANNKQGKTEKKVKKRSRKARNFIV